MRFKELDGLQLMLDFMHKLDEVKNKKKDDQELMHELIRCLRAFLNSKVLREHPTPHYFFLILFLS